MFGRSINAKALKTTGISMLVLVSLTFFASCGSGTEDPATTTGVATVEDYLGSWSNGSTQDPYLTIASDTETIGGTMFSIDPYPSGSFTVNNGTATLTAIKSAVYDNDNTHIRMHIDDIDTNVLLSRASGDAVSIEGTWTYPYLGTTYTIVITMSGSSAGTFTYTKGGTTLASGTCVYYSDSRAIALLWVFGTATLNGAKDTMTLSTPGDTGSTTLTKVAAPQA